jgi:hypothetical protein
MSCLRHLTLAVGEDLGLRVLKHRTCLRVSLGWEDTEEEEGVQSED